MRRKVPRGDRLIQDATVKAALGAVTRNEPQIIEEQVRLCEIPAPPFKEMDAGRRTSRPFEALG